jgi:hypothetical protein
MSAAVKSNKPHHMRKIRKAVFLLLSRTTALSMFCMLQYISNDGSIEIQNQRSLI